MTAVTTLRIPVSDRAVVVLLVATAAGLVLTRRLYQAVQIALAGLVTGAPTVHFGPDCTSAFLLVPLLLVTSTLVALRPRMTRKALVALVFTALALVVVDQLRILSVVGLVGWLGPDSGFYLGHTLLGSLISGLGGAASLVLFVWLTVRRERP